jgi:hypothetical protein
MSLMLDGGEYLWQRDEAYWPRCAPVLFPIVGNLRDDRPTDEEIARTVERLEKLM